MCVCVGHTHSPPASPTHRGAAHPRRYVDARVPCGRAPAPAADRRAPAGRAPRDRGARCPSASGSARAGRKSNSKKENEIIMHYNRTNTTRFVRLYRHRYWVHRDARGSVINNSGVTLTLTRSTSAAPAPLCLSASAPIAIRGIFHISISRRHPPTRHGDGDITIARRPPAGAPAWSRQHKWRTRPPAEHDAQHRDRRGISTTCERNR